MGNDWGVSVVIPHCLIKSHCNNHSSNNNPNKQDKGSNSFLQLRTDVYSLPYGKIYVTGEVRREMRRQCQCSTVRDLSQQVTVGSGWDPWRALLSVPEIFKTLDICSSSLFSLGHGFLQYVLWKKTSIYILVCLEGWRKIAYFPHCYIITYCP